MSVQSDIEAALVAMLDGAISGLSSETGPRTPPQAEGVLRAAHVRKTRSAGTRLEFGQTEVTDQYALTVQWHVSIARKTVISEWEAFAAALLADQYLGGAVTGLVDAFLTETFWSEAHDANVRTQAAVIEVERVE